MRVKAGNQLSQDVQTLDFGSGVSLTETNGDVAVTNSASQPVLAPAPSGDTSGATDTAALQAAITSALAQGAKLVTANNGLTPYYLNDTLVITPPASSPDGYAYLDWEHHGYGKTSFVWAGANSKAIVSAVGWKRSTISGVKFHIPAGFTGVIGWDLDVTVAHPSLSNLTFQNCVVNLTDGANIGWRIAHTNGGVADVSFINWNNCFVVGNLDCGTYTAGSAGWINEGSNSLNHNWFGGGSYYCDRGFTTVSTAGAGNAQGAGAAFFHGYGTSHNNIDFEWNPAVTATLAVFGGRFENGQTSLLSCPSGSSATPIIFQGITISQYPTTLVFNVLKPCTLILDACYAYNTAYATGFITLGGFTSIGTVYVRGGSYRCADPMWSISAGTWHVNIENVGIANSSGQATAKMTPKVSPARALSQTTPADPAGTTSTAGVMMGLAGTITPVVSGSVEVTVTGTIFNPTAIGDGAKVQLRQGTGGAPANAAALTGATFGNQVQYIAPTTATKVPFALTGRLTGLTIGTATWIDVQLAAITAGTATISDVTIVATEVA